MTPEIYRLYFVPTISAISEHGAIGGVKEFIAPSFAKPTDYHIIYKTPLFARLTPVIFRRPCTIEGAPATGTQIAPFDFSNGVSLETGKSHPGAEIRFNEAVAWDDAPAWVTCALRLAEDWYRPFFQKKTFAEKSLRDASLFLNPSLMGEVIERTNAARKSIGQKMAVCLFWEEWSYREFTNAIAAREMKSLGIDREATEDSVRKLLKRTGLPALRNGE